MAYLHDVLSGKIYKQNVLIGRNINKLLEKVYGKEDPDFIKDWIIAFCLSSKIFLDSYFFERTENVDIFLLRKHLNINELEAFNFFKILGGFHLTVFLNDDDNSNLILKEFLSVQDFEIEIFKILEFTRENVERYYFLDEIQKTKEIKEYFYAIYSDFAKTLKVKDHNPIAVLGFSELLKNIYLDVFIKSLSDSYKKSVALHNQNYKMSTIN